MINTALRLVTPKEPCHKELTENQTNKTKSRCDKILYFHEKY